MLGTHNSFVGSPDAALIDIVSELEIKNADLFNPDQLTQQHIDACTGMKF
jgi:hypothetical protein